MKKIVLIGLLCLMTFTLTGCKKFAYNFELDDKGNLTVYETEAINMSALEIMSGGKNNFTSEFEEISNELKSEGYNVKLYDDGVHKGLTKSKKAKNISEYKNKDLPVGFISMQATPVVMEKAFMKNKYTINWMYEFRRALESTTNKEQKYSNSTSSETTMSDAHTFLSADKDSSEKIEHNEIMKNAFEETLAPMAELSIVLPQKARSTNANSFVVDGKKHTYKWNLSSIEEPVKIELIYEKTDFSGAAMVLSLVLLFAGLMFVMLKMKDESSF